MTGHEADVSFSPLFFFDFQFRHIAAIADTPAPRMLEERAHADDAQRARERCSARQKR
jgi:hypothetical protein